MSEIDASAREEGRCGYIGDGRETPCQLTEGWGHENTDAGLCRNHSNRGGQDGNQNAVGNSGGGAPEGNTNGETHGAYKEFFRSSLTDDERAAADDVVAHLEDPRSAQEVARTVAADYLIKYQNSGDERFGRRFESICEKFNITPSEDMQHKHEHDHNRDSGTRELSERELRAFDSVTGGPETIDAETDGTADWTQDTADEGDDDLDADEDEETEDGVEDGDGGELQIGW